MEHRGLARGKLFPENFHRNRFGVTKADAAALEKTIGPARRLLVLVG